ncbi:hypothetical protein [Methanococcoides sp. FTZ1]
MNLTESEKRFLFNNGTLCRCSDEEGNINWGAVRESIHSVTDEVQDSL